MPDGGKVLLSADGDLQDDIWEFLRVIQLKLFVSVQGQSKLFYKPVRSEL